MPVPPSLLDTVRTAKPRAYGITIALDTGRGLNAIADLAEVSGSHCDYAKLAWGSVLVTENYEAKIAAYRGHGIIPLLGGTLFEYAYLRNKVPTLLDFVRETGLHIEISDGVATIPRPEKLKWISEFAKHVEVFSEVGGKVESQNSDWPVVITEEFSAGAKMVVVEGREIGPVGKEIRGDLVDRIVQSTDVNKLIFEALERPQQVWLIKHLGPNVNLGNIRIDDVLTLESFRRGLKEHTLLHAAAQLGAR